MSKTRQDIYQAIKNSRSPQSKVVFVSGNFNMIHTGHLRLLSFAAECGDILVVGVQSDRAPGAMVPQALRVEAVRSISMVNYVLPLEGEVTDIIRELKPEIVVKGREFLKKRNEEQSIIEEYGGKMIFSSGEMKFSSTNLLYDEEGSSSLAINQPVDYLKRHNIDFARLSSVVEKMKDLNVVVIGDTIVDEYITCEALGLSQEDPTIVVRPIHRRKFIGGAGIVASHAAGLGANVHFCSVVGNDDEGTFAENELRKCGVKFFLQRDENRPTTLKQRFRTNEKTLLRVSTLLQHSIEEDICKKMLAGIKDLCTNADLVIFSDFNYGCLPQKLVNDIVSHCIECDVMMVADSQSSSQIGDVSRFENMNLLTPTEREARIALKDFESGLVVLAESLRKKARSQHVFITLAAEGVLIHAATETPTSTGDYYLTDQLPSFNPSPRDTAGAGDSMLVASSLALAAGENIWVAAYLGSLAAARQVSRVGNISLSSDELTGETFY